jgi:hypothetical protein
MEGGVGRVTMDGGDVPVDAISWGPCHAGVLLRVWVARHRIETALASMSGADDRPLQARSG